MRVNVVVPGMLRAGRERINVVNARPWARAGEGVRVRVVIPAQGRERRSEG